MQTFNEVKLIGRVGQDPTIRPLNSGEGEWATFSLATNEWNKKTEQEEVTWHNCKTFNPSLVTLLKERIKKGFLLMVDGPIGYSVTESGESRNQYIEITARRIQIMEWKKEDEEIPYPTDNQKSEKTAQLS